MQNEQQEAAGLHAVLLTQLGEPVPAELYRIIDGEQKSDNAVDALIAKIQDCGGTYTLEYWIESDLHDVDLAELWAWWLRKESDLALSRSFPIGGRK